MLYFVFLGIAILICVIYAVVVMAYIPGLADERLGVLEELPEDVGEWKIDTNSAQARSAQAEGLVCETRLWRDGGSDFLGREKILRQVRYLDPETREVVRAEKDVRIKRKRVKKN